MAIDFTLPSHVTEIRDRVRAFIDDEIEPAEAAMRKNGNWRDGIIELRRRPRWSGRCRAGCWLTSRESSS